MHLQVLPRLLPICLYQLAGLRAGRCPFRCARLIHWGCGPTCHHEKSNRSLFIPIAVSLDAIATACYTRTLQVALYLATVLLSNIVANNAAAALMYPIAINVATQEGIDKQLMAFLSMLAAYISIFCGAVWLPDQPNGASIPHTIGAACFHCGCHPQQLKCVACFESMRCYPEWYALLRLVLQVHEA